jgi:hypothetical protein
MFHTEDDLNKLETICFGVKYDREYIPGKTTGGITVTNAIGKQILCKLNQIVGGDNLV